MVVYVNATSACDNFEICCISSIGANLNKCNTTESEVMKIADGKNDMRVNVCVFEFYSS